MEYIRVEGGTVRTDPLERHQVGIQVLLLLL
jgi:hypothetical protein